MEDSRSECKDLFHKVENYRSQSEHWSQRCDDYDKQLEANQRRLDETRNENRELTLKCDGYSAQVRQLSSDYESAVVADLRDQASNAELKDQLAAQVLLNEQHSDGQIEATR